MDVKLVGSEIVPLRYRIRPERGNALGQIGAALWDSDETGAYLAYSDRERDDIVAALRAAGVASAIISEPQPDPALLAACQGKVSSRSEALAALAAGVAPVSLDDLAVRLKVVESKVAVKVG